MSRKLGIFVSLVILFFLIGFTWNINSKTALAYQKQATCTYPDMYQRFNEIALLKTYEQLSRQMQAVLHARANLNRNMNRTLLMEQLMLNLQEGYTFV